MWDFLKKLKKAKPEAATAVKEVPVAQEAPATKPEPAQKPAPVPTPAPIQAAAPLSAPAQPVQAAPPPAPQAQAAPVSGKPHEQKTDEELAEELNGISPEILSQAKSPEMRKIVLNIYRKMLVEGVDVHNDKEVRKWLKKHPEAAAGGETQKVETVKRTEPKVGRNDPCHCGSGKKYKKCHGAGQ